MLERVELLVVFFLYGTVPVLRNESKKMSSSTQTGAKKPAAMTAISHQIAAAAASAAALPTKGPTAFLDSASLLVFAGALLLPARSVDNTADSNRNGTLDKQSSSTASTLDVELQAVQQQQLREVAEHKF
ncbi:hypothetical protein GPALN_003192 [Globodera pallida]|nr:hypothetical protein GPALN_003192 [Globodera pallida]